MTPVATRRALLGTGLALPGLAHAQAPAGAAWPNRPLRMIMGGPPGGSGDLGARLLAGKLTTLLGQPCIVENKPGATGALAAAEVARAAPDGYTLLFTASWHSTSAVIKTTLPYDTLKDFSFVSTLMTYGMMLAVRPDSPYRTLEDLIAAARRDPGRLTYYSVGIGSAHNLIGEWLNVATGAEITHVPYRGSGVALPDFLAGRVDLMIETMTVALAQVQAGKARPLAVTSAERLAELPDVRRTSEIFPGFTYDSWLGLLAPPNLPPPLLARLNGAVRDACASPEIAARIRELGAVPAPCSPEEFRARVTREIAHFAEIVETRKIPKQE
jgi:tripartite-type tricarboxylate transporter receptor subunit TctC